MTAAVTAGCELIRLRRVAGFLAISPQLAPALEAFARGNCGEMTAALALVERHLEVLGRDAPHLNRMVRTRASLLALTAILDQHSRYFCTGTLP